MRRWQSLLKQSVSNLCRWVELEDGAYEEMEAQVEEAVREAITRARRTVLTGLSKRTSSVLRRLLEVGQGGLGVAALALAAAWGTDVQG